MPPRSPFPLLTTPSDARTATLQGLLIGAIVIAGLYVGREVLLPLALAILLSFVLTPPLLMLRKIKVPRVLAVGIVVAIAFGIHLRARLDDVARGDQARRRPAELPAPRCRRRSQSLRDTTSESKRAEKGGRRADRLAAAAQRADQRRARRRASARRR